MSVCALVGGQFGSEGKGLIAGHIAHQYDHHVRVGAANAGHTIYTVNRLANSRDDIDLVPGEPIYQKHVMQQLPCAAYANPAASLYIGPGAQISHEIFDREMERLLLWRVDRGMNPFPPIFVDPRAHVIQNEHIEREQQSGLAERIGSTSTIAKEGIGAAQAARVMREDGCCTASDMYLDDDPADSGLVLAKVPDILNNPSLAVLLEGTQGAGLSLTTGFFPFCTSRNTTAAGLCADAGVAPNLLDRVILVCRTYPIRVAGPSGPFHEGSTEIVWPDLDINPENERTTVTKKIRRVATFSMEQVVEAAVINGATEIALTFADYLDPEIAGASHPDALALAPQTRQLINDIVSATGVPVSYVGTGPHSVIECSRVLA